MIYIYIYIYIYIDRQTDRLTDSGRVELPRWDSLTLAPIICSKRQPGTYRASTHVQQLSDNQQRRLEAETERGASTAALCSTG